MRIAIKRILITGAFGQIGSELTMELRKRYGGDNVVAVGHDRKPSEKLVNSGPYGFIDVTKIASIEEIVRKYDIDTIYHMAAILSPVGEKKPQLAWNVNMNGLHNILEISREYQLIRIFCPSSTAVFGPCLNATQDTSPHPRTIYGVTKVAGEFLCDYYFRRFGLDVRGIRYPGIISSETHASGGTTDYAVTIFHEAIKHRRYTCFVREDTILPMMYMPDCIKATIDLMNADISRLKHHSNFSVAGMSFSAGELATEIKKHIPEFTCEYRPDFRQEIADSWPKSIDDNAAREEWGWKPNYSLATMTKDLLEKLQGWYAECRFYSS